MIFPLQNTRGFFKIYVFYLLQDDWVIVIYIYGYMVIDGYMPY